MVSFSTKVLLSILALLSSEFTHMFGRYVHIIADFTPLIFKFNTHNLSLIAWNDSTSRALPFSTRIPTPLLAVGPPAPPLLLPQVRRLPEALLHGGGPRARHAPGPLPPFQVLDRARARVLAGPPRQGHRALRAPALAVVRGLPRGVTPTGADGDRGAVREGVSAGVSRGGGCL